MYFSQQQKVLNNKIYFANFRRNYNYMMHKLAQQGFLQLQWNPSTTWGPGKIATLFKKPKKSIFDYIIRKRLGKWSVIRRVSDCRQKLHKQQCHQLVVISRQYRVTKASWIRVKLQWNELTHSLDTSCISVSRKLRQLTTDSPETERKKKLNLFSPNNTAISILLAWQTPIVIKTM